MTNVLELGLCKTVAQLVDCGFDLDAVASRREPQALLMCPPDFFEVKDAKNPFMEGNLHGVDVELAKHQWAALRSTYEKLGYQVNLLPPAEGLEDMVFTANQVLPGVDSQDKPFVVAAKMVHASRRREVPHFLKWFSDNGYAVRQLDQAGPDAGPRFEGQGDAVWHPKRRLLWGGYGFRTEESAYDLLLPLVGAPILKLQLVDQKFYHLDTAFCALDEHSVLVYAPAFAPESLALIRHVFRNVVEVSAVDADNFVCNALALGKHVILQRGSAETCRRLSQLGFEPVEVDTSEFMKSGGSVFCLKMQVY